MSRINKAKLLEQFFVNRTDTLAFQSPSGTPSPFPLCPDDLPLTDALLAHVDGDVRLGTYTPRPSDSKTKWLCLDFDGDDHHESVALDDVDNSAVDAMGVCVDMKIPAYLERSGGGVGWHLWVFFSDWTSAARARSLGRRILARVTGGDRVEMFPKADRIPADGYGNLVWMPYWGGAASGLTELHGSDHTPLDVDDIETYDMPAPPPVEVEGVPVRDRLATLVDNSPAAPTSLAESIAGASLKLPTPPLSELPRILAHIPNSGSHALSYDEWFRVLAACFNSWGSVAEDAAREWSENSDKHDDKVFDGRWYSLESKPRAVGGAGAGTLIYMAQKTGYLPPAAPKIREIVDPDAGDVVTVEEIQRGSHVEIAKHLRGVLGGDNLIFDRAGFYEYDVSGYWRAFADDEAERLIHEYDGLRIFKGFKPNGEPKIDTLDMSAGDVRGVGTILRSISSARGFFDGARPGVAFRNGFLSVDGLVSPDREHRCRHYVDVDFDDNAPHPLWDAYLRYLHPTKATYLQEKIGACLFGDATSFARATVLLGDANAGKSTFLDVIHGLFQEDEKISIAPQDWSQEYRRARLARAKINLVAEMPEADIMGSENVKAIITGDVINARFIREGDFDFRPRCGHIIAGNALPHSSDLTSGFWRRWVVVEFDMVVPEGERIRGLAERIVGEELVGVYAWAYRGYQRLVQQGRYTFPHDHERVMRDWELRSDQLKAFIAARCTEMVGVDGDGIGLDELYRAYIVWAQVEGRGRLSKDNFRTRMEKTDVVVPARGGKDVQFKLRVKG